jgi:putative aldouronate transport system permease protein
MRISGRLNKIEKTGPFDVLNGLLLLLVAMLTIFPFYYVVIISFADYSVLSRTAVYIFPTSFNLDAYKAIMGAGNIVNSFFVSVVVTVLGTILSLAVSVVAAYALSKPMPGRNIIFTFMVFTMFFSGGLIPYYLTVKAVGLVNSPLVLILPMAVNTFYLILLKNYFATVPPSLEETAKMDGANDVYILWKIVLPTCAPIIATIALFYAVDRWNEWYHAMLFIQSKKYYPLQLVLREVLFNFDQMMGSSVGRSIAQSKRFTYQRSVQMAIVVIATVPILLVYPYLQRHFTQGIMLGSIKE